MKAASLRHKHLQLDQGKLDRARRILGAKTETEALDRALSIVVSEAEIDKALGKVRGKGHIRKVFPIEMQRVIIDTSVYIDWMNDGLYEAVIFQRDAVKHLSAVVIMELAAGAFSVKDRRLVRGISSAFGRVNRIVAPTVSMYQEAGEVLRKLQASPGYTLTSAHGLANDVLIALSALSIGAVVITQNDRDFAAIQKIRPFQLSIVAVN